MVIHVTVYTVHTILQLVGGVPSIFYTASLITFPHSSHHSILGISTCSIGLLTTLYLNDSSPFLGLELEGHYSAWQIQALVPLFVDQSHPSIKHDGVSKNRNSTEVKFCWNMSILVILQNYSEPPVNFQLVMCRPGLGLGWLFRAWASQNLSPSPEPSPRTWPGLAWAKPRASAVCLFWLFSTYLLVANDVL